ncbi:helix-turn-helix protein [Arenibacter sp. ARW7G5Y1]|nr:helix-turn-helix protein [Arenibacter sp. ARW7G5Y1]
MELGISQQSVSLIEQSETIEKEKLEKVAKALGVTAEAIKNFSDEAVFNIISNTYNNSSSDSSTIMASSLNYQPTFNPIDKIMELVKENRKLYQELLKAEKDKVSYLEKLLNKK